MRRIALSAAALFCLAVAACGWVEESREAAKHDATGMEALLAAERGDLETLRAVLAKDPKAANGKRWTSGTRKGSMRALTDTALTVAVRARNLEAVDLLGAGADANFLLDSGEAPLDVLAAAQPRDATALSLAKALVARGARLAPRTWERTGETTSPLHTLVAAGAVRDGEDGLLRLFASERSALSATNGRGLTPLHIAAMGCQDRTVEVLLEAGADPIARTVSSRDAWPSQRTGDTPLHSAADCGRSDVVFALCAGGANPRLTNGAGETPLAAYRRIAGADPGRSATAADPRKYESVVAALGPDGPCEAWYGRFLREGRPARWEAVRVARYELGCSFDSRSDCGDAGWAFEKGEGSPSTSARRWPLTGRGAS
ncbi:MAG: ankyrin repeat domain-containing protein [Holophagales bacterium]|nr:ankyrin repeat domain-containing protein [Holophagales bacterium]